MWKDWWNRFWNLPLWQRGVISALLLITVIFFMDLIALPLYTRHGSEYELPDVTARSVDEALALLDDEGFIPRVQDSVFDNSSEAGTVLRQNPAPYAMVKKGRRVYLVVSSGERPVVMPDLRKESLTNAELRLRELGLRPGETRWAYSQELPYRGVVIGQSIAPGENITGGRVVDLTVSLGASPSAMVVPNLVGKSLEAALQELEAVGIRRNQITLRTRYQPNLVPSTIVSQSVGDGTPVVEVNGLELTVSTDKVPERDSERDSSTAGRN